MADEPTIGIDDPELDDAALEALAMAHATAPPARLRAQVLSVARQETAVRRVSASRTRWRLAGAVAATVALVLGAALARQASTSATLVARLDEQGVALAALRESLAAQAEAMRVISAPRMLTASLAPKEGVAGTGRVLVDQASGEAAIVLTGVAPAPAGRTYELWTLRGERPPEPAGLLTIGPERSLVARVARVAQPAEVTAFAVSIEPAAGSQAPTGPIVLVGTVAG